MWKTAAAAAAAVTLTPLTLSGAVGKSNSATCLNINDGAETCDVHTPAGLSTENVLLQQSRGHFQHVSTNTPMVNDESGFEGGDFDEISDTTCQAADVRRRRQSGSECSCRRRNSGKRYDGGWVCQNDKMAKEAPKYTNPIWAEEFEDERGDGSLNESRWELKYTGSGNGNKEKQFYTKRLDNLKIEDGILKIRGKREDFEGKQYTSGKIQTRMMGDWGPGVRVEVRAKLPLGVGTWPAIWMMPTENNYGNWPDSGEIDIMEAVGKKHGKVFGTIHTGAYNHMRGTQKGKSFYTDFSEWHTYALEWHEDRLEWFADGNLYNTFKPSNINDHQKWPFNRRFYLILNLALGGNLGGPIQFDDEQVMEVDYARVFCLDGSMSCKAEKWSCCSGCAGKDYCSPQSGNCYDEKRRDYYETCEVSEEETPSDSKSGAVVATPEPTSDAAAASCCQSCGSANYCSPNSGNCYYSKAKDYYETCRTPVTLADPMTVLSYNVMYSNFPHNLGPVASTIKGTLKPDIMGNQECMNMDAMQQALERAGSELKEAPDTDTFNCIFYNPGAGISYGGESNHVYLGDGNSDSYSKRYFSYASFLRKDIKFWVFSTHWCIRGACSGSEAGRRHEDSARRMLQKREELGANDAPTIIVGDLNSHMNGLDNDKGVKYFLNNGFEMAGKSDLWGGIDYVFVSKGHWKIGETFVGPFGGSDHKPIQVDVDFADDVSGGTMEGLATPEPTTTATSEPAAPCEEATA